MRSLPGVATLAAVSRRAARAIPRTSDGGVLEGRRLQGAAHAHHRQVRPHRRVALSRQSLADVKLVKNHFGVHRQRRRRRNLRRRAALIARHPWRAARRATPGHGPGVGPHSRPARHLRQPRRHDARADPHPPRRSARAVARRARGDALGQGAPQDGTRDRPAGRQPGGPAALFARAARVTTSVALRHPSEAMVNTVISNVPGSPAPLYLSGARLEALYPISGVIARHRAQHHGGEPLGRALTSASSPTATSSPTSGRLRKSCAAHTTNCSPSSSNHARRWRRSKPCRCSRRRPESRRDEQRPEGARRPARKPRSGIPRNTAEGVGFEPTRDLTAPNGFRDLRIEPQARS